MTQLLQYMTDQKIPEVARIKEFNPTVEKRANIKVHDYLGFGAIHTPLQTKTYWWGKYYGEVDADGKGHCRGILIWNNGRITIGYFENDDVSTGNYITIYWNGEFRVGKYYTKDGVSWERGTQYYTNGKEEKYDEER